ncbi:hypothetical protein SAMN06269117_10850 [Balnearium lithotrophicum]|uniref:Tetratricopeptide repeat-like domain-containing protein n=1 Tax=Balnearium lithotrophicum TaxID=223788 RepID=A0A521BW83_9BACT|nr:tetratricopeptide repeat protein [Balnearium lithotrophicum]SMO51444.1 hypothetical protein SAMN06269117_10850 [Balnearium lithotrophicum]
MKKPPYKVLKKKEKREVSIPEKIDTPQAEQLVSDIYFVLHFLEKHRKKILSALIIILLFGGVYAGYSFYSKGIELKAAEITDKGLYYLDKGDKKKAIEYFKEAVRKYGSAPSGKLSKFLLGKLTKSKQDFKDLTNVKSFLLSPPSKTSLSAILIDEKKLNEAKGILGGVKRDEWTHPEAIYDKLIISLMENKKGDARMYLETIKGNYSNLPISQLAERLMK